MPTYDYICDGCGHEFEAYEPITAEPRKDCPECGRPVLRRKIGPGAAILFKGSGFYQTDYRSESYKSAAKAEQEHAKSSGGDKSGANGTAGKASETKGKAGNKSAGKSSKSAT
jgi:putative FmdB family regulatory protein